MALNKDQNYETLASNEGKLISKLGVSIGADLEGPSVVMFTDQKVNNVGSKSIGIEEDAAYDGYKALGFIDYIEDTCTKMQSYFDNSKQSRVPEQLPLQRELVNT